MEQQKFESKLQRLKAKEQIKATIEIIKGSKSLWRVFRKSTNEDKLYKRVESHQGKKGWIPSYKYLVKDEEVKWDWKREAEMQKIRHEYRHWHIAYCLLRGTPYEKIEKPKEGNEPNQALIEKYVNFFLTIGIPVEEQKPKRTVIGYVKGLVTA